MIQPMDLQVVLAIYWVDDKVTNTIMGNLVDDPLVGALRIIWSLVIEEIKEVVNLTMRFVSYNRNPYENNTIQIVITDDLVPWVKKDSNPMV